MGNSYENIKTSFDNKEEEKATIAKETKTHEKAMTDAAEYAIETNDEKLFDNATNAMADSKKSENNSNIIEMTEVDHEEIIAKIDRLTKGNKDAARDLTIKANRIYKLNGGKLEATLAQIEDEYNNPTESKKVFVGGGKNIDEFDKPASAK